MNILSDKQIQLIKNEISADEYYNLYFKLREKDEKSILGKMSLRTRQRPHKLMLFIFTVNNKLGGYSYEILNDKHIETKRAVIYAVTHIGKFDVEIISEAIRKHYYLLSGDYEHLQGIIDEKFLMINGVFFFNESIKEDRKKVSERMIGHLQAGGNIMYFPEGAWNLSPNLPVLPCYWGIVDVARKGNAIIVPIAADQYGKHFKINIGSDIDMSEYGNSAEEKTRAINDLRDTLATLKWEIWETEHEKRENVDASYWDNYIRKRLEEWTYYGIEYINSLIYTPKDVVRNDEAFEHLNVLAPKINNAFLFSKRNYD